MSSSFRSVVIHGHFYQPPREDPWLELVPREPSAAPFHDWNRRIEAECYRTVAAARLLDRRGRIRKVVNALAFMSFDFGPTLLSWLEREAPETYEAILEADRASCRRLEGHGNAMAMPYHHAILPLSTERDRLTEVRWGLSDFRRRFGREPEGMWLPEAAVDDATLDVLAREGIGFTVLGPGQVDEAPARGLPGLYRTRSGNEIAVFVYDGELSHDVAFGSLLADGRRWAERMAREGDRALTSLATDGETYGHHRRFGETALVTALDVLQARNEIRVESYASFLARNPPEEEVTIVEPSSWSCVHGVERWRSACGCALAPDASTRQEWRRPLREAMTWLAGELHRIYEDEAGALFRDPWAVRDAYGRVVDAAPAPRVELVRAHAARELTPAESTRALELLEMERNALRLFTSCAWFFDDLARIEAIQVLRYAARALELAEDEGPRLESELLKRLAEARSIDPAVGDGRSLYERRVRPAVPARHRVAAGCALLRAAGELCRDGVLELGAYRVEIGNEEGLVTVIRTATGRRHTFQVEAEGEGVHVRAARVTSLEGGPELRLTPEELPEPIRERLEAAIRRTIVATRLSEEERKAVADGDASLGEVASRALVRAIRALRSEGEPGVDAALELLKLLEIVDHPLPWEARSAFARIIEHQEAPEAPARLRPLARALGFSG